jgi:acyl-CoA synthetase (AMP-forming)/AMP-acid ligase II
MNLMMMLDMATSGHPSRTAVGGDGEPLTYEELYRRAGIAAARIRADGVEHVAYIGTNSPAFAVAVFASAWAGVPILPINYRLGHDQIASLLAKHANVLVIADDQAAASLGALEVTLVGRDAWLASTDSGPVCDEWHDDPEGIAVLLYTSGTTSAPKAAILRHRHLLSYVFSSVDFGSAEESDAVAVTVPPYHVAGVANLISNIYAGRRLVYLDAFTPEAWLETVRREQVTHAMVVPTMLARIVESLNGQDSAGVTSLQTLSYGGSRISPSIVARALVLFPTTDFVNAYGLTETSSTIALLGPDDHRSAVASEAPEVQARLGSAGRLIPGIEAEVRDSEGVVLGTGEVGELWLRGEQVSGEYLSLSSPLDDNGWFPTRDRAFFDLEGYLFIEGRSDDTIIRGGENIAPAEIEEVLVQHATVAEAAVVGVPDDEWGQRIVAVVVPATGSSIEVEELQAFARGHLRSSKTPDRIFVWDELPYTDTGKLLRREVIANLESSEVG